MILTLDRTVGETKAAEQRFRAAKQTERQFLKSLRQVARVVAGILAKFDPSNEGATTNVLRSYAEMLRPWSRSVAARMVAEVDARSDRTWRSISREIGERLEAELTTQATGQVARASLDRSVTLITSLPLEAAERVQAMAREAYTAGTRSDQIVSDIMRLGDVTLSRAKTIARTEVSRVSTEMTKARAESVGSTHFRWVTAGDSDVRPSHRSLNNKTFRWDDPPECDPGKHALPGAIFNCRCIPIPILD